MVQQHVTATSGAATTGGAADTRKHGSTRRCSHHDYKDNYRNDGEGRGDNRTDGRQRRIQRSEGYGYGYGVRDRRESQYDRDSDRRGEYRSRPMSQAPTDARKGGKSSRGHHESTGTGATEYHAYAISETEAALTNDAYDHTAPRTRTNA